MTRLRRSVLYVPASNPRALDKARTLPADLVIVDLEDAVGPHDKDAARAAAAQLTPLGKETLLRVNALGTPWHAQDIAAARAMQPHGVVLPKVNTPQDVERAAQEIGLPVWPMMEKAKAILAAPAIASAAASTGEAALIMGTNDLAGELGVSLDEGRAPIAMALQACVLAARAAGVDIIDGVSNAISDDTRLIAEVVEGKSIGMTGKSVIHPRQIGPVNNAFSPSAEAVAEARRILEAVEKSGGGVSVLDGKMIEALHAKAAERLVALAEAIKARSEA